MAAPATEPPRITHANAADFPPPSLNAFRTDAARAPADCAPARWFKQMTGGEWDRTSHCYEVEKKRWRRLGDVAYKEREYERDRKRIEAPAGERVALYEQRKCTRDAQRDERELQRA